MYIALFGIHWFFLLKTIAKFQNSIFQPLQMPPPAQYRPGRMPPSPPPLLAATGLATPMVIDNGIGVYF